MPHRLGIVPPRIDSSSREKNRRRPIWVHALSVGEVVSAVPLLEALKQEYSRRRVLLSVSTLTGYELARTRLSASADAIFFYPYDIPLSVRRITNVVDPALMVIVETDIWPNMVYHNHKRRIPLVLVNARLSPGTFSGYCRLRPIMGPTLGLFSKICTQTEAEADRFHQLGVAKRRLSATGNFKFDQTENTVSKEELTALAERIRVPEGASVFVAGSTHKGEETLIAEACRGIHRSFPGIRLIIVPRNPDRAPSVGRVFSAAGFSCLRLIDAEKAAEAPPADVLIVDVIGVLRVLYQLSTISFVGGSLVPRGGHNPLEPAACGKPVLFGPHMTDFPDISRKLRAGGGAMEVHTATDIQNAVTRLLTAPEEAAKMGQRAFTICQANRGAVTRTLDVIGELLRQ